MNISSDHFQIEWHGGAAVVIPAQTVESLRWDLIENAAEVVMAPLKKMPVPIVVFDLSHVKYFGSVFLSLLLRCHNLAKSKGGELVICGAGKLPRELLATTALDIIWAIYDTRQEALEAVA